MNIGIIGNEEENTLFCQKIFESKLVDKIICFPETPGPLKLLLI